MKIIGALGVVVADSFSLIMTSAGPTDASIAYDFDCQFCGYPITVHGDAPATVLPGAQLHLTNVFVEYTSPVSATYTGIRILIPAPPGATGPDLIIDIPTLTLGAGERYTSTPISGAFVASNEVGTVIEFRPK